MNPKNKSEYWRISSKNLQQTDLGKQMMCKWLERLIHPFLLKEIEAMKKMDKSLLYRIPCARELNKNTTTTTSTISK